MGCDPEEMDIVDAYDAVLCEIQSGNSRICTIEDFFPKLFPQKKRSQSLNAGIQMSGRGSYRGIRSAEQFTLLTNTGFVRDLRDKK